MYAVKKNNPAGRLYHIFHTAQAKADSKDTLGQVWVKVFALNMDDGVKIAEHRRLIIHLIDNTKKNIKKRTEINHALYLGSLPDIKKAMEETTNESPWTTLAQVLTDKVMTELSFCSDALSKVEAPVEPADLETITKKVEALQQKIAKHTTCDEEVRELIVSLLEVIRRGIRGYEIIGASALQETLAVCIGRLFVMRSPGFAEETETEILSEMKEILAHIDAQIGKAFSFKSQFETLAPLLPGATLTTVAYTGNGGTH